MFIIYVDRSENCFSLFIEFPTEGGGFDCILMRSIKGLNASTLTRSERKIFPTIVHFYAPSRLMCHEFNADIESNFSFELTRAIRPLRDRTSKFYTSHVRCFKIKFNESEPEFWEVVGKFVTWCINFSDFEIKRPEDWKLLLKCESKMQAVLKAWWQFYS